MLYVHISNIKWVMVNQHSLPSWLIVSRLRAFDDCAIVRKVFRYRRGNQNQETEEGQTCNVRLYVVINVLMCDWVCFFSMEGDIYWLFIVFIYMLHLHCSRRMVGCRLIALKCSILAPLSSQHLYFQCSVSWSLRSMNESE
jgi:hypothetical protein